jgi:hypothetical protein
MVLPILTSAIANLLEKWVTRRATLKHNGPAQWRHGALLGPNCHNRHNVILPNAAMRSHSLVFRLFHQDNIIAIARERVETVEAQSP